MPLLDHFHPPLSDRRPWESFHTTWAATIADDLNERILPSGYIALEHIHTGAAVETDIGAYEDTSSTTDRGGAATATRTVWQPATDPTVLPAVFPPHCTIEIRATEGGRTLVAAIELISPASKDRMSKRLIAAKCATYLSKGIGLVVIDVVTSRQANLHNDLVELLDLDASFRMPDCSIYSTAYRPLCLGNDERIETWPMPLAVGQALPTMPLSLAAEQCIPVDLESSYLAACQRRRLDRVTE